MWAQPFWVEYQETDLSLFSTTTSLTNSPASLTAQPSSTKQTPIGSTAAASSAANVIPYSGISTGAKVGIAIGAALGALFVLSGALFFCLRRRNLSKTRENSVTDEPGSSWERKELDASGSPWRRNELDNSESTRQRNELDNSESTRQRNELDVSELQCSEFGTLRNGTTRRSLARGMAELEWPFNDCQYRHLTIRTCLYLCCDATKAPRNKITTCYQLATDNWIYETTCGVSVSWNTVTKRPAILCRSFGMRFSLPY